MPPLAGTAGRALGLLRSARPLCVSCSTPRPASLARHPSSASVRRRLSSTSSPAYFRILALESSADDTAAACVDSERKVLSSVVIKQHDVHAQFRGIHPMFAQHAHTRNMPTAIRRALDEANLKLGDIDAFAFTQGPGMFGCLSVGCSSAGALAAATGKPLVGVNHMQGHALTCLLETSDPPRFPFLTLLISGGHSQLLLATGLDAFEILVDTGELPLGTCFDRLGGMLALEYGSGLGPALEQVAATELPEGEALTVLAPIKAPRKDSGTFDFAGILHSLQHEVVRLAPAPPGTPTKERHDPAKLTTADKIAVARAFQAAVTRVLVERVRGALDVQQAAQDAAESDQPHERVQDLVVSGGVACNSYIRENLLALGRELNVKLHFPPLALCTDNAAMIGNAAVHRVRDAVRLNALDDTLPRRRWSLEDVAGGEREKFI